MNKRYLFLPLIVILRLILILSILSLVSKVLICISMPDVSSAQQQLENNRGDIEIITDFMINSGHSDFYIHDSTGIVSADLEDIRILDSTVYEAINRVLEDYIMINKFGNTIYLLQWRSMQDIGCGIAYSINGTSKPEIQYATELIPISEDGWFYYVSD